jgi:trehalose synthase
MEIKEKIKKTLKEKTKNSIINTTNEIKNIFFTENFKSDKNWKHAVQTLEKFSEIDANAVREALKFKFKKSKNTIKDYEKKLKKELGKEGKQIIQDLKLFANEIKKTGKNKIILINATFVGGGPAEMFETIGPILKELGMEPEWHVIYPKTSKFYDVTKAIHNTIQGNDVLWNKNTTKEKAKKELNKKLDIFEETNKINAKILKDIFEDDKVAGIFIEDPQVSPLVKYGKNIKGWRLHVDVSGIYKKNPGAIMVWKRIEEYLKNLKKNSFAIFQPNLVVPIKKTETKIIEQYPGIDPLAIKNSKMPKKEFLTHIKEINSNKEKLIGGPLNTKKPIIVTGARFDYWKGLTTTLRTFEQTAHINKNVELLVFGGYADDDPEGLEHLNLIKKMREKSKYKERIHILINYTGRKIGALYKLASKHYMPFVAYSSKEGYNLMTNENEIRGGASITSKSGGLDRYITNETAIAAIKIDDITKKIEDASKLYTIKNKEIIASKEALELEKRLKKVFEKIMKNHKTRKYRKEYKRISSNAKKEVYRKSFISMFKNYFALILSDIEKTNSNKIPSGDHISKIVSSKLNKKH